MIRVSVVTPVYAGAEYLETLVDELAALRERWPGTGSDALSLSEVIFVDDNAIDDSPRILDEIAKDNEWISVIHLASNFGQHAATIAGILHSSGDWIVTMDEDLQHPPARIPSLLEKAAKTGCDIVYARPRSEVHKKAVRDFSSRAYKRIIGLLTRNPYVRDVSSFRMIRGSIARGASAVCTHDTYFDVVLTWFSKRIEVVSMELEDHRYITTGGSGYSFSSLLSHARRMLATSHLKVLRAGTIFGALVVGASALGGVTLLLMHFFAPELIATRGWTSLMLTIAFFGGLVLLFIGLVLEYLSLLVLKAHGRPLFFSVDRSSDKELERILASNADDHSGLGHG